MNSVKYSVSGDIANVISFKTPSAGALNRTPSIMKPAPTTRVKSIKRSLRNGRVRLMPQAALIPFLIAPNAAVDAHRRPSTLAIPVIVLEETMPWTVWLMYVLETGKTFASSLANCSCSASGPSKKPKTEIMARNSGKMEKSV